MPDYYLKLIGFFVLLIVGMVGWMVYGAIKKRRLQTRLSATPTPESYLAILRQIPHYQRLDREDRSRIEYRIRYFIENKEFIGRQLEITDEIRVTIAFYACLLLLHIPTENCYDNLKTIIVYPYAVVTEQVRANGGIFSKEKMILSGQSANDTVVISWHDAKKEAYHLRSENVVIHEFAHEIDFMDGEVDGVPPLALSKYHEWSQVMYAEFKRLNESLFDRHSEEKYKLLGAYAATNEAEFFAVLTERFFESPRLLAEHFPNLYNELKDFYRIDPIAFEKG
jgi:Mlc titration factor MtfA (ptsG expression regulator)